MRILTGLMALGLATSAQAEVDVEVRADRASRVYLAGQYLGDTPLTLKRLKPGTHQFLIEDVVTRETRTYMIPSPEALYVERTLEVRWAAPPLVMVPAPPPPVAVVRPAPPPPPEPPRAESRGKTHTRNALVGATVLSQILTKDSRDRKRQRNVGLGAIGLSEIFRK